METSMQTPRPRTFRPDETQPSRERGFSLLEVLIALLVLSVGLLGIAGLQTFSLQFNHQSYERTQATVLISEMFEKIATNPVAARAGVFDNIQPGDTSGSFTYGSCPTSCTATELANFDLSRWKTAIEDPRKLAQGQGTIARIPDPVGGANGFVYQITINWVENNGLLMTQIMRMRTQRI